MAEWDKGTIEYFQSASPEEKLQILRHEIITPIGTIRGIETLLREMDLQSTRSSPEELNLLLDQLAKAGNHLNEVVNLLIGKSTP